MRTRIGWASCVAVLGLAVALVLSGLTGAGAAQGDPVLAGEDNTADLGTIIEADCPANCSSTGTSALTGAKTPDANDINPVGVEGFAGFPGTAQGLNITAGVRGRSGVDGVIGIGTNTGVLGFGSNGLEGQGTENGVLANGGTFGVFASGTDYGVYGSAPNHGVYGTATTNAGAGVEAQSNSASGIGLRVTGKAQFSRSGTATITGSSTTPKSSVVITNVQLSSKSLVLATPQKDVTGVWVQGAVPNVSAKTITIFLNKTVTASYPVAWFVVEKP
jgi:hypothetical protein